MSPCLVATGLMLGCLALPPDTLRLPNPPAPRTAPTAAVAAEDRWFAEDKLRHFALSFAATAMAYGGARAALDADAALVTAGAVAFGLGLGKEVADVRAGRGFSLRDLVWDAAGVALGLTLVHRIR